MRPLLDSLARYARAILLIVSGLLATGAVLAVMGLPMLGWSIYIVGHLGLLLALAAVAAMHRAQMDWFAWLTFAVTYVGVALGAVVALIVWGHYAANPDVNLALLPSAVTPLGLIAGLATWIGLGLFGWAMYRVRALPTGGPVLFVVAAVFGVLGELAVMGTLGWLLAVVTASLGLVWIAPEQEVRVPASLGATRSTR